MRNVQQSIVTLGTVLGLLVCVAPANQAFAQPGAVVGAPVDRAVRADTVHKSQPQWLKLKLGHFVNKQLGVGVVIDLSEKIDNVAAIPPAKVRFDGESKVWRLKGQHGGGDRIDYLRDEQHVMLHVWPDGRRSVFVYDPTTEKSSDEIDLTRDGDADPL